MSTETTSDPSDSRERVEAALKPWGWTCGPDFWDRYHRDPWVFNLTNALTRVTAELEKFRAGGTSGAARWDRLTEAAGHAPTTFHLGMVTREALEDDDEAGTPPPRP